MGYDPQKLEALERKTAARLNIVRGDIVLDTKTMQFGIVSAILIPMLSFQSVPYAKNSRKRPQQIKARMINCVYMGSLWSDAWGRLADYGIRDSRMTLQPEHHWIDWYKFTQTCYIQWLEKDYSTSQRRLYYAFLRFDTLDEQCRKAGSWDDTLKSLRGEVANWQRDFQRLEDQARDEAENTMEYWLRVADTY